MSAPPYKDIQLLESDLPALNEVKKMAHKAAFDLLVGLDKLVVKIDPATQQEIAWDKWYNIHTICTSESLTAGMIMSTLVDIPWAGVHKYGAFGVYDTDAKRVFNNVSVDDVYTHRCAKEMAVGILKNSNATVALSVTGNAMPVNQDFNKLGEVFIGVAGYVTEDGKTKIIYQTTSMNACDNDIEEFKNTCKVWHGTLKAKKSGVWNPRWKTALVSQEIRHYTTYKALQFCLAFIEANNLVVPQFIFDRKAQNKITNTTKSHRAIPQNKYNECLEEKYVGEYHNVNTADPVNGAEYNKVVEAKEADLAASSASSASNASSASSASNASSASSASNASSAEAASSQTVPKTPPSLVRAKSLTTVDGGKRSHRTHKSNRTRKSRRYYRSGRSRKH